MKTETLLVILIVVIVITVGALAEILLSQHSSAVSSMSSSVTSTVEMSSSVILPPNAKELPYNPNNKTVFVYLVVENDGPTFNYNGTSYGSMKIYIPAGWNVMVILTNDQSIPHNANLITNDTPIPNSPNISADGKILLYVGDSPSSYMYSGVQPGHTASGTLTNIQPGYYWIACEFPGHAENGMWIDLVVSSKIYVPYEIVSATPTSSSSTTSSYVWGG